MTRTLVLLAACLLGAAWAQQYTTPVPILKQINRHNEDGSYSYGYEGADGSFKIETKYPTGEVYGKYGYVDDAGQVREVEYGASRRGFEPAGNDINVAPPTLTNDNNNRNPLGPNEEDDGQYREDPSIYYKNAEYNKPRPQHQQQQQQQYNPPQQQQWTTQQQQPYNPPQQQQWTTQQQQPYNPPQQQQQWRQPQPQQQQWNQPQQQQQYNPPQQQWNQQPQRPFNPQAYLNPSQLATHPAVSNIDVFSGSYSISYKK